MKAKKSKFCRNLEEEEKTILILTNIKNGFTRLKIIQNIPSRLNKIYGWNKAPKNVKFFVVWLHSAHYPLYKDYISTQYENLMNMTTKVLVYDTIIYK